MPSKTDLGSLLEQAQSRWLKYDEEERKRQAEEQKKFQQVDKSLDKGRSWEDISKQTGLSLDSVREYSQKVRPGYGINTDSNLEKFKNKLQSIGYKLGTTPGQEAATSSLDASQEKVLQLMRDPSIPNERKTALLRFTSINSAESPLSAAENTQAINQASPTEQVKNLARGVADLPADFIEQGTRQFRGGVELGLKGDALIKAQELAKKLPEDIREGARGLNPSQQAEILKLVSQGLNETQLRNFVKQAQEQKRQADLHLAGTAVEASSLALGGGGLKEAFTQGGKQLITSAAKTGISGAAGGAGYELRTNPTATGGELIKSGLIGGGFGLAAEAGAAGAGSLLRRARADKGIAQGLIDESRQLPARAGQGASVITDESRLLGAGEFNPDLAVMQRGADIQDVKRLQVVEKRISAAQQTGNITADEARSLMSERQQLVARIQNPDTPIARELNQIDEVISQAPREQLPALQTSRTFLEEEAAREAASRESAELLTSQPLGGQTKVSRAAAKTETAALEKKLTEGFDNLSTYETFDTTQEASRVVDFLNSDYEAAKKIALGEAEAPAGTRSGSFYKAVEARALREGDVKTLEQLGTESALTSRASRLGQEIQAFAYRDPESPVTAFKAISEARKTSALSIPRTVAPEEAEQVVKLAKNVSDAKAAISEGGDRLAYGQARVAYEDYVNGLIEAAKKRNLKESLKHPVDTAVNVAGVTKSLRATLDNSALLRQGWKTLFTHPGTWAKNSAKSFVDFAKAVGNKEVIDEVRADIVSRPNSINGLYKKMGVDVFGIREEAFPTSLPERIPVAGRFFKGSEAAYTGFIQRTRADLADKYLEIAQRSGVDLTSKKELQSIGKLVNSLTSRGHLGRLESSAKVLNNVFFSPRLLKSNIDVLTAHQFQRDVTPFVRKRAARNILQIGLGSAAALKLASEVTGGKVDWDPRSSNFGKLKIGDTRFDLSGGIAGVVTLGARIATASSKSSTTGEVKKLNSGEYGAQTTLDAIYNFFENKTAPAVSVMRDYLKGQTFEGEKPTVGTTIKDLTLPLIIGNYDELRKNPRAASVLPSMIADALGVSVNTYGLDSNWNANNSKQVQAFRGKVDQSTFDTANKTFNDRFNGWYDKVSEREDFWKLSQEQRERLVTSKKNALTEEVLGENGFKYKESKTDRSTQHLVKELQKY